MSNLIKKLRTIATKCEIKRKRSKIKNKTPYVLSSNCNGAVMLHDLGLKFNTPTVNLYFLPKDYLKFVSDPQRYFDTEMTEVNDDTFSFPVGMLDDIRIFFMHYKTFEEAKEKWNERKKRVDLGEPDNIFLMFTDQDGCTYEDLKKFDMLPYKHKVVFTHKPYPDIRSAFYIKGYENESEVGILSDYDTSRFIRRRRFDQFDYVSFFNSYDPDKRS